MTNYDPHTNTFIVLNPVAGTTDPDDVRYLIATQFAEKGVDYNLYVTTGEENLTRIVKDAVSEGYKRILAIGGDGTISSVADGLAGKGIPLGIVPAGTGNVLAQELKIPLNLGQAIKLALEMPETRCIDAMQIGRQKFFLNIGIGITSQTLSNMVREDKRRFGVLAYVWRSIPELLEFQPHDYELILDGRSEQVRAVELMVVNAGTMGMAPFTWDPEAVVDNGKLGVCVISAQTLSELPGLAVSLATGTQQENPSIQCFTVEKQVQISSPDALPVQADGELIGELPITVRVIPSAVPVIVPVSA